METETLEENGISTASDEKEEKSASPISYTPPSQFKLVSLPPLVQDVSSDNMELWLIRIQDNQLGPEDFKERHITFHLKPRDDKLGSFQSSKGIQYDVLDLHRINSVQPFAFMPKANAVSLDALRISRQVAFVRSLDPVILSISPDIQEDQIHQNCDPSVSKSSKQKYQGLHFMHMPRDGTSGKRPEQNQTSIMESLQENEEQISTVHFSKSAKKKLKEEGFTTSPLKYLQEDQENQKQEAKSSLEKRPHKDKRVKI